MADRNADVHLLPFVFRVKRLLAFFELFGPDNLD
jgi:hypothetical protein